MSYTTYAIFKQVEAFWFFDRISLMQLDKAVALFHFTHIVKFKDNNNGNNFVVAAVRNI